MADPNENCPVSLTAPFTVTVNTSASVPSPVEGYSSIAALSASALTQAGFTNISKFSFAPTITAAYGSSGSQADQMHKKLSTTVAKWEFGDGYSLSGSDVFSSEHIYKTPGIYTVSLFLFDQKGTALINTFTKTLSIYNYKETNITLATTNTSAAKLIFGGVLDSDNKFNVKIDVSWQDYNGENTTIFLTSNGSRAKPYDTTNKYAHLIPYNSFHKTITGPPLGNNTSIKLTPKYFYVSNTALFGDAADNVITLVPPVSNEKIDGDNRPLDALSAKLLYATTDETYGDVAGPSFYYYDDIPTDLETINILISLDTSKHKLSQFYDDRIDKDINTSELNYLESNVAGVSSGDGTLAGFRIQVAKKPITRLTFTSTGMKEMSSISYKRQSDKFQIFVSPADENNNILKYYPELLFSTTSAAVSTLTSEYTTSVNWSSGGDSYSSLVSSISTNKFPYNTSLSATSLSSFLYLNIDPLSAGSWTLSVSARFPEISAQGGLSGYGGSVGTGNAGGCVGAGLGSDFAVMSGSYTFTVNPSTNSTEIYKINEDIDYSNTIKSYRFQSFLHDYDKLFDGVFTAFVGQLSSSPTTFGKTIYEKIANFAANTNDIDTCNIDNIRALYDLLNEDIDFTLPNPPPGLKRLYDLFSIKISKLIGDYERIEDNLDTQYFTNSAAGRNVDFTSPITPETYTVTAGTTFVARQKFNNEFLLINPQKVPTKRVDGSSSGESSTYPLSSYNVYSNWGWSLDTSVIGASGLSKVYDFYPYTTYNTTTAADTIKNSVIDFNNQYTTLSRATTSLSASWENDGGVIYDNLDYQIRKGLIL